MNHDQFTYWLQGFVEMNGGNMPNEWQWRMIKDHLKTCFVKVTPTYPNMHPLVPQQGIKGGTGNPLFPQYVYHVKVDKPKGGGGGC